MINVGFLIAAIICFILMLGLMLFAAKECDESEVALGVGISALFIFTILFGCSVPKPKPYLDKYKRNIENVKEYRVDTTFTTTNGVTDTTYTIYYNKIEEKD